MIMIIIAMRSGDTPTENLKARHCSHCFQYFLASRVLAFFLRENLRRGAGDVARPGKGISFSDGSFAPGQARRLPVPVPDR